MKQILKNKKGNVFEQLGLVGVGILTLLFVVVIVMLIGGKVQTNMQDNLISTQTATNESVTWSNNTYVALANSPPSLTLSCSAVYNDTANSYTIAAGNYTCDTNGLKYIDDDSVNPGTKVYVTYTYKARDEGYNSTISLKNDTYSIVGWVSLLIVVIVGILLLSLVKQIKKNQ